MAGLIVGLQGLPDGTYRAEVGCADIHVEG